ncbi:MAG: VTT domain-containing protein [Granulosicoccus sp.]
MPLPDSQTVDVALLSMLFAGAFFDAIPLFCFIVFGEVFFLMAGSLAYLHHTLLPLVAVLSGAFAADQLGYILGKRWRRPLTWLAVRNTRRRALYRRVKKGVSKRGALYVVMSRLLGPIAWITPTLAGSLPIPYARFMLGSAMGVVLGVGQFCLAGALLARGSMGIGFEVMKFLQTHTWTILLAANILLLVLFAVWHFTRER